MGSSAVALGWAEGQRRNTKTRHSSNRHSAAIHIHIQYKLQTQWQTRIRPWSTLALLIFRKIRYKGLLVWVSWRSSNETPYISHLTSQKMRVWTSLNEFGHMVVLQARKEQKKTQLGRKESKESKGVKGRSITLSVAVSWWLKEKVVAVIGNTLLHCCKEVLC